MAVVPDHFKGKIVLHALLTAQEGQGDTMQTLLKDIQGDIVAGKEPGCLTYRVARSGNEFLVFEEYENAATIKTHNDSLKLHALITEIQKGTLLAGEPKFSQYEEV